ncbi:hypothetical protein GCM10023186_19310 [Hymenobacter koreensis]|uniref:Uncharacterized protein n=1 Tax=Hymenobacter koreensis TaxID=1084523 RepID=A0ABP8IYQ0_9BACT
MGGATLADLNNYHDLDSYHYGALINNGKGNNADFEVTPYKPVKININSSKDGKTDISFSFVNADQGDWFGGSIFFDTTRTNQQFSLTKTMWVLPDRPYCFFKYTANRVRGYGYNYSFRDESRTIIRRTVLYTDTTVINFD